jgi:hypothetical protein
VINESDIAQQADVPIAAWRSRDAPAFRQRVPALFPNSRILIYDLAKAQAHLDARPIPALPTGEHPDDLLNDEEAAALLGVAASTVRAYASQGIPPGGHHRLQPPRLDPPRHRGTPQRLHPDASWMAACSPRSMVTSGVAVGRAPVRVRRCRR